MKLLLDVKAEIQRRIDDNDDMKTGYDGVCPSPVSGCFGRLRPSTLTPFRRGSRDNRTEGLNRAQAQECATLRGVAHLPRALGVRFWFSSFSDRSKSAHSGPLGNGNHRGTPSLF